LKRIRRLFGVDAADDRTGNLGKFRFRRPAYAKWERFTLEARPHSIYMMSGPSREVWEHSIPAVEAQHYSILPDDGREILMARPNLCYLLP
jgi:hypothetical protein